VYCETIISILMNIPSHYFIEFVLCDVVMLIAYQVLSTFHLPRIFFVLQYGKTAYEMAQSMEKRVGNGVIFQIIMLYLIQKPFSTAEQH